MQNSRMVRTVVVLGGGSAGLIAALTLKRRLPELSVRVVRSPEIGIIGVGEGTTADFPRHFFHYLGFKARQFYTEAEPTWKLGLRFFWGPAPEFYYPFEQEWNQKRADLPRNVGFYVDGGTKWLGRTSALMAHGKAFSRSANGGPDFSPPHAFHIENAKLVRWLESVCTAIGIAITDGTMRDALRGDEGISVLFLESGEQITADLFVDASGFRSELVGRRMEEPHVSYARSLFCDRAVIGGWPRTDEPIGAYTLAETMDAGWAWQIEHEQWINRGYVYCSASITDEAARAEFLGKNSKIAHEPRVVKFRSGRLARSWVGNVVAIGNAAGFVEPLEATALHVICAQSRRLADALLGTDQQPTPSVIAVYNDLNALFWDEIRDFLSVHYAFNTRSNTPFWKMCRMETDLAGAAPMVEFYRENGPILLGIPLIGEQNSFGMNGYLAMLCGQRVPHARQIQPPDAEEKIWNAYLKNTGAEAARGFGVKQTLDLMRSPAWKW